MQSVTEKVLLKVRKAFERKADREKVYVTSDGSVFAAENDAVGQAHNLKRAGKSDAVVAISRADLEALEGATSAGGGNDDISNTDDNGSVTTQLTVLELAQIQATNARRKVAEAQKALEAAAAKLEAAKNEHATLPPTAHANKVKAVAAKLTKAETAVTTMTADVASAEAEAVAAEAKVTELETAPPQPEA